MFPAIGRSYLGAATLVLSLTSPAWPATESECRALWQRNDTNSDTLLARDESAARYRALALERGRTVANMGQMSRDEFISHCRAGAFAMAGSAPTSAETGSVTAVQAAAGELAAGANSFTEAQARTRIERMGYATEGALKKDSNGIWRGTASRDGERFSAGVDYRGHVVLSPQ